MKNTKILLLHLLTLASSAFGNPEFYSHVFTVDGTFTTTWSRNPINTNPHESYIYFSRVDGLVSVTLEVSHDNSGTNYVTEWTKIGIDVDRVIKLDDGVYRIIIGGVGTIGFTEGEGVDICGGEIYSFNYEQAVITLNRTHAMPSAFPLLNHKQEFCLLYTNAYENSNITDIVLGPSDIALYTYGNHNGALVKDLAFIEHVSPVIGYFALCYYLNLDDNYAGERKLIFTAKSSLYIPASDIHPPLVMSTSKSPTQSRKVNIITEDPDVSITPEISQTDILEKRVIVRSPLTVSEITTVATTATVSVGMIVAAIVLFIIYIRAKTKKALLDMDEDIEDSDLTDTSTQSYSYSIYYSYTYYYSCSESDSYYSCSMSPFELV